MNKKIITLVSAVLGSLLTVTPVFAHAVVSPKQVGVAAFQDFSLSVPSEKDASTVAVRLSLPTGLNFVTPVVKPGWKIEVKSGPIPSGVTPPVAADGDVADSIPTEIDWTGGNIPSGQKDLFVFSAQVLAKPTELDWKVYQSYSDGSMVSWDLGPNEQQPKDDKGNPTFDSKGPYSKTMVVNDLTGSNSGMEMKSQNQGSLAESQSLSSNNLPLILSGLAFLLSVVALGVQFGKR